MSHISFAESKEEDWTVLHTGRTYIRDELLAKHTPNYFNPSERGRLWFNIQRVLAGQETTRVNAEIIFSMQLSAMLPEVNKRVNTKTWEEVQAELVRVSPQARNLLGRCIQNISFELDPKPFKSRLRDNLWCIPEFSEFTNSLPSLNQGS